MCGGWQEVRWTVYFLILLAPFTVLAVGAAALIVRTPTPSPGLLLLFGAPAAFLSLLGAGLWDGPTGRFGRHVWLGVFLIAGYWLIRRLLQGSPDPERSKGDGSIRLRLFGREVTFFLELSTQEKLAQQKFGWRDLLHVHPQPLGDDRVLIGV